MAHTFCAVMGELGYGLTLPEWLIPQWAWQCECSAYMVYLDIY